MLARLGRAVAEAEARAVEFEEAARQPSAHAGATSASVNAPRAWKCGARQDLGDVQDRRDRDPARLALARDRVLRLAGEQRGVQHVQFGRGVEPRRDRVVARVLEGRGLAQPGPHRPPLARREHDDAHVAVGAREDRVQPGAGRPREEGNADARLTEAAP